MTGKALALLELTAHAAHQLGTLVLAGSLFFLLVIVRPVTRQSLGVGDRQRFFVFLYRYLFRWLWLSLLLLWTSGAWYLYRMGIQDLDLTFQLMALGGLLISLLVLVAGLTSYFHLQERVENEHWPRAGKTSSQVRKLMAVALLLAFLLVLLGATGPPSDMLQNRPTGSSSVSDSLAGNFLLS